MRFVGDSCVVDDPDACENAFFEVGGGLFDVHAGYRTGFSEVHALEELCGGRRASQEVARLAGEHVEEHLVLRGEPGVEVRQAGEELVELWVFVCEQAAEPVDVETEVVLGAVARGLALRRLQEVGERERLEVVEAFGDRLCAEHGVEAGVDLREEGVDDGADCVLLGVDFLGRFGYLRVGLTRSTQVVSRSCAFCVWSVFCR